jgi:hypothetical protein
MWAEYDFDCCIDGTNGGREVESSPAEFHLPCPISWKIETKTVRFGSKMVSQAEFRLGRAGAGGMKGMECFSNLDGHWAGGIADQCVFK